MIYAQPDGPEADTTPVPADAAWADRIWAHIAGSSTLMLIGIALAALAITYLALKARKVASSDRPDDTLSTIGMLLLTQLSESSGYAALIVPLLVFGTGNGLAFVPLTAASLDGVEPADAGAASGLVNVMQQVGGSLGLAVLVTIFGAATDHPHVPAGTGAADAAKLVFVHGADTAFWAATAFLAATLALVIMATGPRRGARRAG